MQADRCLFDQGLGEHRRAKEGFAKEEANDPCNAFAYEASPSNRNDVVMR